MRWTAAGAFATLAAGAWMAEAGCAGGAPSVNGGSGSTGARGSWRMTGGGTQPLSQPGRSAETRVVGGMTPVGASAAVSGVVGAAETTAGAIGSAARGASLAVGISATTGAWAGGDTSGIAAILLSGCNAACQRDASWRTSSRKYQPVAASPPSARIMSAEAADGPRFSSSIGGGRDRGAD